jgi:hypothetical protein
MRRVWCEGGGAGVGVLRGGLGVLEARESWESWERILDSEISRPSSLWSRDLAGEGFLEPNIGFLSVAALVIMGIGGGAHRDRGEGEVT